MSAIVLFRKSMAEEGEFEVAKKYFPVVEHRSDVPPNSLVIARYSALPYYSELEYDLKSNGSRLINSHRQHQWIASFDYYEALKDFTPRSWREFDMANCDHQGPFVVKGATNSRKFQWNSMMYAETKADALRIGSVLATDSLIGQQGIVYKEFVKLKVYEYGLNNLPFSNEWRFFAYKGQLLSYGYYWAMAEFPEKGQMNMAGLVFAQRVANVAAEYADFIAIDIAQKESGEWVMIELNDGSMSGPSLNDMDELYHALACAVKT